MPLQFDYEFLNNTIFDYIITVAVLVVGLIFKKLLAKYVLKIIYQSIKKFTYGLEEKEVVALLIKPLSNLFLLLTFFIAFQHLNWPLQWKMKTTDTVGFRMIILYGYKILFTWFSLWFINNAIEVISTIFMKKASTTESKLDDQLVPFFTTITKIVIITFFLVFILNTLFQLNITSIVAGLGVGGLAVALAAKESIENLIGGFTIFLDKPFMIGDFVKVSGQTGIIENIGFRSTHIRTVDKSLLTIPNKKMVDAELNNFSKRDQRKQEFTIGLTYQTTEVQLKSIIQNISEYLKNNPETSDDFYVRFTGFGENSLNILVFYFTNTNKYEEFLRINEEVNFAVMNIVEKNNSSFAFPTRTIFQK